MLADGKTRLYGKTKEIDLVTLKRLFSDKRASFIKVALLFGSRSDGTFGDKSDYDFALLMQKSGDEPWGLKAKAYSFITELFGLSDCDIDIVDLSSMDSVIKDSIKESYIILKGDKSEVSRLLS